MSAAASPDSAPLVWHPPRKTIYRPPNRASPLNRLVRSSCIMLSFMKHPVHVRLSTAERTTLDNFIWEKLKMLQKTSGLLLVILTACQSTDDQKMPSEWKVLSSASEVKCESLDFPGSRFYKLKKFAYHQRLGGSRSSAEIPANALTASGMGGENPVVSQSKVSLSESSSGIFWGYGLDPTGKKVVLSIPAKADFTVDTSFEPVVFGMGTKEPLGLSPDGSKLIAIEDGENASILSFHQLPGGEKIYEKSLSGFIELTDIRLRLGENDASNHLLSAYNDSLNLVSFRSRFEGDYSEISRVKLASAYAVMAEDPKEVFFLKRQESGIELAVLGNDSKLVPKGVTAHSKGVDIEHFTGLSRNGNVSIAAVEYDEETADYSVSFHRFDSESSKLREIGRAELGSAYQEAPKLVFDKNGNRTLLLMPTFLTDKKTLSIYEATANGLTPKGNFGVFAESSSLSQVLPSSPAGGNRLNLLVRDRKTREGGFGYSHCSVNI